MVKRSGPLKEKTFPHVVSTPREIGGSHHHEFGSWSESVRRASTATASQHLAERRAVDRAERIYAGRHRPDAQRDPTVGPLRSSVSCSEGSNADSDGTSSSGVRRDKAALSSGCKPLSLS